MMVVVYHLLEVEPSRPYAIPIGPFSMGAFGVDIFFVISGFIMWSIATARPQPPRIFLRRRIIRIVPLYWFITLATAFLSTSGPLLHLPEAEPLIRSLTFIPQWNSDFGHIIAPIVKVGWTIELEMFFYLIFAAVLVLRAELRLMVGVTILVLFSVVGFILGPFQLAPLEMYTDSIILEFAYGMVLGTFYPNLRQLSERSSCYGGMGLLLIIFALVLLPEGGSFLRTRGIVYGIPALMVVSGGLLMEKLLSAYPLPLMKALGDSSYSTYLFHLMILVFTQKTLGTWFAASAPWFALISQTAICGIGGYIVYQAAEKPLTRYLRRWVG